MADHSTTELPHVVEFRLDNWRKISGHVSCTAEPGAQCRLGCPAGCESWPCDHGLVDTGSCNVVTWLEAEGVIDCYDGGPTTVRSGPITTWWDEAYMWRYAEVL